MEYVTVKELWYSHGGYCVLEDRLHLLSDENYAINIYLDFFF